MENRKQDSPAPFSSIVDWFRADLGRWYNFILIPLCTFTALLCTFKHGTEPWINPLSTIVWTLVALFAVGVGFVATEEGFKKTATIILIIIGAAAIFL